MSDSKNPFGGPTTVAPSNYKAAQPKRGVAHIVRRAKVPKNGGAEPIQPAPRSKKRGVAHVIPRKSPGGLPEDSGEVLLTPPNITVPMGKNAAASPQNFNAYGTAAEEYTVEEGTPQPPEALLAIAEKEALASAPADDPERGFILVSSGNDRGRKVGLAEGRTTIGRGMDNDVVLTDIAVSRKHMYIERRDNVYFVCDLSSGNGLLVNDQVRSGEVLVVNGDRLRIGNTVIAFEGPEAQNEAAATSNWRADEIPQQQAQSVAGQATPRKSRGKVRARNDSEAESTVAGKGLARKLRGGQDEQHDPLTQAPTHVAPSVEIASDIQMPRKRATSHPPEPRKRREATKPPPMPSSKASVQDAAIAAVASIVQTPPPGDDSVIPIESGELPNLSIPPTPSPAIPYPVNAPRGPMTQQGQGQRPRMPAQPIPTMGAMPGGAPAMGMPRGMPGQGMPGQGMPGQGMPQGMHGQQMPGQGMPQGMGAMPGSGPMHLGSGPMPPMGYGAPNHAMSQGSGPMLQRPMIAGAGPDIMMRPPYPMTGTPPQERGKLLIGIIAVALVLVVVGIVAAVMGQKDESTVAAGGPTLEASSADDTGSPSESGEDSKAGDSEAGNTEDPGTPEGTDTKGSESEGGDSKGSESEAAIADEGGDSKGTDGEPAAATEGADSEDSAPEPLRIASLIANNTTLPASTWGTDEAFLKDIPKLTPAVEPIEPSEPEVQAGDGDGDGDGDEPEGTDVKKPEIDTSRDKTRDKSRADRERRDAIRRDNARKPKPDRAPRPRNEGDDDDDDDDDGSSSNTSNKGVAAAKTAAKALYKRRRFEEAAETLSSTADRLNDEDAEDLLDLAAGYKQVGVLLASAEKLQNTSAPGALAAYKKALSRDKNVGGSAHAKLIRLRIGQIAPKAAMSYMAKGRLTDAKKAADDAARYDERGAVEAVYKSLERKADSLIRKALKAKKKGDNDKAKDLLRDATKIAPKDTPAYEESRKELRKF